MFRERLVEKLTERIVESLYPTIEDTVSDYIDELVEMAEVISEEKADGSDENSEPTCPEEGCEDCPHYPCDEDDIDEDDKTININISDEQAERLLKAIFGDTGFFGDRKKKRTKAEE